MFPIYGFRKESYPSLKDAAIEAVQRIYESGLMYRDGTLGPGGNNVRADNAARPFTPEDLRTLLLSEDRLDHGLAQVIALRQDYMKTENRACLKEIYDVVQDLEPLGFVRRAEKLVNITTAPAIRPSLPEESPNTDRSQYAALGEYFNQQRERAKKQPPASPANPVTPAMRRLKDIGLG